MGQMMQRQQPQSGGGMITQAQGTGPVDSSFFGGLKNSMPGMGGTDVADPGQSWGNMDSSQRAASVLGGAKNGLAQGLQNYSQQNAMMRQPQGGGMINPAQGAAPVDSSYFMPQQSRKPNSLFYGYGS
jgi:hypothetical protein